MRHRRGLDASNTNIYDLTEGRNICVITDEGRFSMLTIAKRASAATGTIDFHYTTWP
jgi:hypothetical protein